jgi:hypothetical protein
LGSNEQNSSDDPMNGKTIKFIIEYDSSASGINTVGSGSSLRSAFHPLDFAFLSLKNERVFHLVDETQMDSNEHMPHVI